MKLSSLGLKPAVQILDAASRLDSDDIFISCSKETFELVRDYFSGFDTVPPIIYGKFFLGIRIRISKNIPFKTLVLSPSNDKFIWW
jgi:hypothetical protein